MIVKPIYCNANPYILKIPDEMLPDCGKFDHHFSSTVSDNLIEVCGRVCYDSAKSEKSRSSSDYHQHINKVNHGSVQESRVFTVSFNDNDDNTVNYYAICINRPGVYVEQINNRLRITANIRAAREWNDFNNNFYSIEEQSNVGWIMKFFAKQICPMAMQDIKLGSDEKFLLKIYDAKLEPPITDEEVFVSFFISGISRNLTHELVRHKWRTAISQRSTRYVDESESEWCWHPLLRKYMNEDTTMDINPNWDFNLQAIQNEGQNDYEILVAYLQSRLKEDGELDSFSARKQARGAARGVLGTCLSTELIFTASLAQWKRIILQRCNRAADAEIRIMCSLVFDSLCKEGLLSRENFVIEGDLDEGYHINEYSKNNNQ